jgi:hypothetical protein
MTSTNLPDPISPPFAKLTIVPSAGEPARPDETFDNFRNSVSRTLVAGHTGALFYPGAKFRIEFHPGFTLVIKLKPDCSCEITITIATRNEKFRDNVELRFCASNAAMFDLFKDSTSFAGFLEAAEHTPQQLRPIGETIRDLCRFMKQAFFRESANFADFSFAIANSVDPMFGRGIIPPFRVRLAEPESMVFDILTTMRKFGPRRWVASINSEFC